MKQGDLRWGSLFAVLLLMALGIQTKFRNPVSIARRQLMPRIRKIPGIHKPSNN